MFRLLIFCALCLAACSTPKPSPEDPAQAIRTVLDDQVKAWNNVDIEGFMEGYWKSDSILFIGSKVTQGWTATLERYRHSYPGKAAMGKLAFDILRMDRLAGDAYMVTGRYSLQRASDAPTGMFTLLFRRKAGKWVIVYDHTSS